MQTYACKINRSSDVRRPLGCETVNHACQLSVYKSFSPPLLLCCVYITADRLFLTLSHTYTCCTSSNTFMSFTHSAHPHRRVQIYCLNLLTRHSVYPQLNMSLLKARTALIHIDYTRRVTHCVSICMDSCRFICNVGHSADLCIDVYGDLLLF